LAYACAGAIGELHFRGAGEDARSVFVVNHGWHSAIVVKKTDIPTAVLPEITDFPEAEYLEFGWGDRDYYQAPDPGLGLALKAAFWSKGSVLHVAGFEGAVEDFFHGAEIIEIGMSSEAFEDLMKFIAGTFLRSGESGLVAVGPGLYSTSRFYSATGRFHLFRTCNTWVAEALSSAGVPISPGYAVTAGSLMDQVKQFGIAK
jgi:uncharacterized protein (TIGR02117 family)